MACLRRRDAFLRAARLTVVCAVALGLPCAVSGAPRSTPRASGDAQINGARLYYDREIVERAHAMRRDIPGAQEVVVKGAGHMVNLEKPREFNRALDRFVNRVFP